MQSKEIFQKFKWVFGKKVSKERALAMGKSYFEGKGIKPYPYYIKDEESGPWGRPVEGQFEASDLNEVRVNIYNAPQEGWIIFYPNPHYQGICSSYAIIISKITGEVIFDGDARNEG